MVLASLALALMFAFEVPAQSRPPFSPAQLTERAVHRRAVEAVIWGMPAVNAELMALEALKAGGEINQFVYWSRPADWKNQTLTPNPDSIYFMSFYSTKDVGPLVVEVPPAVGGSFAGNIVNAWQMPLEDAGPEGADKGKGGKYLLLPPGYTGKPPAGYIPLRSDTYSGFMLMRSSLASHSEADVATAVAYGKRLRIYPLKQAAHPPPTEFKDVADVVFDSTIPFDLRFFQTLDRVVQREPWLQRDRAMIDPLRSVGIEKGKPFEADPRMQGLLNAGAADAHLWLEEMYSPGFAPFYPGSHWGSPGVPAFVEAAQTGYANPDSYPVDVRGLTYTIGFTGIKRLGTAQSYLLANRDRAGVELDGARTYRLRVPAGVPVKRYWSVTVYDRATHALIRNLPYSSRASQTATKNADGTVDVFFGPKAPTGKEANWVPTSPSGKFELLFRVYGPEKAFFEKTWRLPDVERID
ncbi:MAG TPA: DUF1254 domain-containing protein, partial [Myxococcaceae bacterium]|nr:DUF1254 domain-containing protein [Myxococcaceae bacterium]